jgi:hypothetical protein
MQAKKELEELEQQLASLEKQTDFSRDSSVSLRSVESNRLLQGLQCQPQVCREANRLLQGLQCLPQVCKDSKGFFKDLY